MKILHIGYDDINNPWFGGGVAVRTHEIYKRMTPQHDITVLSGAYPDAEREEMIDGVRYVRIGSGKSILQSMLSFSFNIFFYRNFKGYDLVVKELSPWNPTFTPFLSSNIPAVAIIQGMNMHFFRANKLVGFLLLIHHEVLIRIYKNYVLSAQHMFNLLRKKIAREANITVVPCGVEDRLFDSRPAEENYILFLGRFDIYQKGLDILLEAFKKVLQKKQDLVLVLAGRGRETERLKRMIKEAEFSDQVQFVGEVVGQRKRELLEKSLFVVMPSRWESWGMVALEAGACEKAVIGTQIDGLLDAIKNGKTGILVPPEDPAGLAQAIIDLVSDGHRRKVLGKAGKEWARKFVWDNLAVKQEQFYCAVGKEAKKGGRL